MDGAGLVYQQMVHAFADAYNSALCSSSARPPSPDSGYSSFSPASTPPPSPTTSLRPSAAPATTDAWTPFTAMSSQPLVAFQEVPQVFVASSSPSPSSSSLLAKQNLLLSPSQRTSPQQYRGEALRSNGLPPPPPSPAPSPALTKLQPASPLASIENKRCDQQQQQRQQQPRVGTAPSAHAPTKPPKNSRSGSRCSGGAGAKKQRSGREVTDGVRKKRRLAANARERRRMDNLNQAFDRLRSVLPQLCDDRKLSKYDTLQMAHTYITTLADLLI